MEAATVLPTPHRPGAGAARVDGVVFARWEVPGILA